MTKDLKDLVPAQEKLEWVTPKISQLVAGDTDGRKPFIFAAEGPLFPS